MRRVVSEGRPHLGEQLGAAALEAAELPELCLLDVGHVGLADLPAEVGRLRGQPFGLVEPAGQQRLARRAA